MANTELGIKRICPETGKNFYDLNKNPIVSPYTDKEYPLTFFEVKTEQKKSNAGENKPPVEDKKNFDIDETDDAEPEIISLSEVEEEENKNINDNDDEEVISDIPDIDDDDDDNKLEDDTFLEEDAEDSDLSNVIGTQNSDDKDEV